MFISITSLLPFFPLLPYPLAGPRSPSGHCRSSILHLSWACPPAASPGPVVVAFFHVCPGLLQLLVRHEGSVGPATEWGASWRDERHLMPSSGYPGITASSRQTCDSHGCCTLNDSLAAHGLGSDRVQIWELTVGVQGAWVEVLKGWGGGGGGWGVDRRLVRCEV